MLKEVGLLDNAEMADQIAQTEHKQDILVKILKEVTASCPKCKMDVARRLSQITGVVEPIEIIQEANGS
jgi:Fe-S oxidoreductase